jgi:hypothetical protein
MLADAHALVGRFHAMIRKRAEIELEPWIESGAPFCPLMANRQRAGRSGYGSDCSRTTF